MIDLLASLGASIAWTAAIALLIFAIITVVVAIRFRAPALGLVGVIPPALGALGLAVGIQLPPAHPVVWTIASIGLAFLGIVGGNPITLWVLGLTSAVDPRAGAHGGIVVPAEKGTRGSREVLRGGWVIGSLERFAIVAAIVLGHFEIIAGIIAIKGLGRFTELDNAEARERFIIGTLTSMIWAAACAVVIVLARPA